ncbi:MAG: hypothetical protein Q4D38_12755, partial [Planctomycetia bacterium]|nr:hypothetical protein [Planctomycetia bacterium]
VPLETPAEIPAEVPAETPTETPAEAPADTPAEVPTETPADTPAPATEEGAQRDSASPFRQVSFQGSQIPRSNIPSLGGYTTEPAAAPVEYYTFEEKKDEIRQTLAENKAFQRVREIATEVSEVVSAFQKQMLQFEIDTAKHNGKVPETLKKPVLDLSALEQKYGVKVTNVPLGSEEKLNEVGLGYTFEGQFAAQQLFAQGMNFLPVLSMSENGVNLSWTTEIREPEVPTLDEVRDEVIAAWKLARAKELAAQKAQELASECKKTASLAPCGEGVVNLDPFTWMEVMNGQRATVSYVSPLETAAGKKIGNDFMQTVFGLKANEVGIASSMDKAEYYVVLVTGFTPSDKELQEKYVRDETSWRPVLDAENQEFAMGFFQRMEDEAGLVWKRPVVEPEAR